ncbi:MAG: TRAP transporter small permease subunit, partial [Povalibacter sp.]
LLTDRIGPKARGVLQRISALLSVLFFAGLAAGSLWLTVDAWNEYEQSELLHIPFRPLRVISFAAVTAIAVLFLRELFKSRGDRQ